MLHKGPFRDLKWVSQEAYEPELVTILKVNSMFNVSMLKPICEDQEDLNRGKSQWRQVRAVSSCKRDVQNRETVRVRRQHKHKLRQRFRGKRLLNREASQESIEALS